MNQVFCKRQLISVLFLLLCFTAHTQCGADFSFQQDVCSPKTISFSTSLTGIQSFSWNFGNGVINTTSLNPTVTYSGYNLYNVSLTVNYTNGCTDTHSEQVPVLVQEDYNLIATGNSSICAGDSVLLESASAATDFCWSTGAGSFNTTAQSIYVHPTSPTTYYYVSQQGAGESLTNGDFSAGNTGFTSGYINCNSFQCISEQNYAVGPDGEFFHFDFRGHDHTTGTGNFMMVNGAVVPNVPVWCQSAAVTPNTTYTLSMWICTMAGEYAPAQLQFTINGLPVGTVASAPGTILTWINHTATWNSGSNTTANFCVVSRSDWFGGNDFGIDDISLSVPGGGIRIDSVNINVQPTPELQLSPAPVICSASSAQLSATTSAPGITWSPAQYLNDPASLNPQVTGLTGSTMFYAQVGNGNCIKRDSLLVIVSEKPGVSIDPVSPVCSGTAITLHSEVTDATSFAWYPSSGLSDPTSLTPTASPGSSTIYTLIASNGACVDSSTVIVSINEAPAVHISKSNDISCSKNAATLTATGAGAFTWTPQDFIIGSANTSQVTVNPNHTITYYVEAVSSNGCIGRDSISVKFDGFGAGQVFVPNAFTPNGDTKNDLFKPRFNGNPRKYECRVFDRWGELVFYSEDPAKGWNGNFKSSLPLAGVYVYWIKIESECGSEFLKGTVLLIK